MKSRGSFSGGSVMETRHVHSVRKWTVLGLDLLPSLASSVVWQRSAKMCTLFTLTAHKFIYAVNVYGWVEQTQ